MSHNPPGSSLRLNSDNMNMTVKDFVNAGTAKNTNYSTNQAVRLYREVMREFSSARNFEFIELESVMEEDLPRQLEHFFMIVNQKDGSPYNASSLETFYQSIARFLSKERDPPIDIKISPRFKKMREVLKIRREQVAKLGARPGKNKSNAAKPDYIKRAYDAGTLGRSNPKVTNFII